MIKAILIFLFSILFISCKNSLPSGVLQQQKMQDVLWDVLKAESLSQEINSKDSSKSVAIESSKLTRKVFSIHDITEEDFKKSYYYYADHPDLMKTLLDSIYAQQTKIDTIATPLLRKNNFRDSIRNQ